MTVSRRGGIQSVAIGLAVIAAVSAGLLWLFGGLDARLLGVKVTMHDPLRPFIAAALSMVVYVATGGRFDAASLSGLPIVRVLARVLRVRGLATATALTLATGVAAMGIICGSKVAGGSDSWGYLGFSEQLLRGEFAIEVPLAKDVPWPDAVQTFAPLGYRPANDGSPRIVPTYSAGFPLMLAAAKKIAGEPGKYLVVPACGAILVLATFGLGRRLVSPASGVIGAALVATSPIVIQSSVVMLSDLPTAAAWSAALYFLTGASQGSALLAGLAAGLAVFTRPNHLPLIAVLASMYLARLRDVRQRPAAFRCLALFAFGAAFGIGATAIFNARIYGSPFLSGYGALSGYFSLTNVVPNLRRYPAWIAETQTPVALLGLVALVLPFKRLWPVAPRSTVIVLAMFVGALCSLYLIYSVFGAWEYLRFVVAIWPPMMVGLAAGIVSLLRSRRAVFRWAAVVLTLGLPSVQLYKAFDLGVFSLWESERRYISGALMTAKYTVPNSIVLSMQHSGSVRYYAGRVTLRYDALDSDQIDGAIAWLTARGIHAYLLVEDWEFAILDRQWPGTRALEATKGNALAVYRPQGSLYLFDLSSPRGSGDVTDYVDDVIRGVGVPGPVEVPALVLRNP